MTKNVETVQSPLPLQVAQYPSGELHEAIASVHGFSLYARYTEHPTGSHSPNSAFLSPQTVSRRKNIARLCEYVMSYKSAPIVSTKKAWRLLRAQSVPAWEVAAQLGHKQKSVSTTEVYASLDPACLSNSVVAIDDLLSQVMS